MNRKKDPVSELTCSALLTTIMLILGYIESLFPIPGMPGLKLGLSNSVLMLALYPVFRDIEAHPKRMYGIIAGMIVLTVAYLCYVELWRFPADIDAALEEYRRRDRRFGGIKK